MTADKEFEAYWIGKGHWYIDAESGETKARPGGACADAKAAYLAADAAATKREREAMARELAAARKDAELLDWWLLHSNEFNSRLAIDAAIAAEGVK